MEHYEKIYVGMVLSIDPDGKMKPVEIEWINGRRYAISKILDRKNAPPRHVGSGMTVRYRILVQGRERELYHEQFTNRWFMEKLIN